MNNSKSGFIPILVAILVAICSFLISGCGCDKRSNEKAQADKKGRYLTIINNTEQTINEVRVTLKSGAEIESAGNENPDKRSFSVEIPKAFKEYDVFIVSLTDVFGMKYEKEVRGVSKAGRTDVVLTEDDYVKRRGDLKRRIDKFFNGE